MTTILSSVDDELSDVEVVYEEVSPQRKTRQELHMLEMLRDSHDPIPANYNAFRERVGRLKYTFCREVVDSVWSKLKDIMILEKEGKLGSNFNRHSLCGRENCVCGKEQDVIELTLSENESDCRHTNNTEVVFSRVEKASVYETRILNQHAPRTASFNNSTESAQVYSKSCRETVSKYKKEIETHNKKTNKSKKNTVDTSESELPNKRNKSKYEENSEITETVGYSCHKRKHCENSREEYSSVEKETHTSDDKTHVAGKYDSNNKTTDTEIKIDSDTLLSSTKEKKQKESVGDSTDNLDHAYKNDVCEREKKRIKKNVSVNISEVQSTDKFKHLNSSNSCNENTNNINNEKRKHNKIENENVTSFFYNSSSKMDKDNKSDSDNRVIKNQHKKPKRNSNSDSIPNVVIHNYNKIFNNNENSNRSASGCNEKHKVKDRSWSENLSGITKHMCELIENDMKMEENNCGKASAKTNNRRKRQQSHSYSSTECSRNDTEQSVTIDAHIQIVHSSKNGGKSKDNNESFSDGVVSNGSPEKGDNTGRKSTQYNEEKHNRNSKAKLKKFFEIESKKRRKETEEIINHEWQLIHDRLVQLMIPKVFEKVNSNRS